MSVHVLVPAHNEAATIAAAVRALHGQTRRPYEVTVVADNCADATAALALAAGATVLETSGNTDKKAGALNQALARLLPRLRRDDYVMVLDADTVPSPRFVEIAVDALDADPSIGAVGGVFFGDEAGNVLEQAQANEYARYCREVERTRRVMVLTGTAAVVRVSALRQVAASRGRTLPGRQGDVYDRTAITEDMELTLALKSLDWRLVSPVECTTTTELMPTLRTLHRQRLRWYRGALDNLHVYGWTPVTRRYWLQQAGISLGILGFAGYLLLLTCDALLGVLTVNPWWTGVGAIFLLDRLVTVWRVGKRGRLLAVAMLPELFYDLLLQVAFVHAVHEHRRGQVPTWHHGTTNHTSGKEVSSMYNASGAAAAGGSLAFTGALALGHYLIAALALIAVGAVLVRLTPRRVRG